MYLYEWDGKTLKEEGVLAGNQGALSVLAFSPDGTLLAAGEVSMLVTHSGGWWLIECL